MVPPVIEKLAPGVWKVSIYLTRDPSTGRYRRTSQRLRGSRSEAKQLEAELLRQRDNGLRAAGTRLTLGDYLAEWHAATASLRERTTNETYQFLTRYVVAALGNVEIGRLQPLAIQRFYDSLRPGLSPRTILDIHRMLSSALRQGVRWRYLERNVCELVQAPRVPPRQVTTLNREQTLALLEAARGTSLEAMILTAASTGLRKGELLGLRWQDVSLDELVLRVQQSAQRFTGGLALKAPKTSYSRRTVIITPQVASALRRHRALQLEHRRKMGSAYQDLDLVFAGPTGLPRNPSTVRRLWLRTLRKAGLEFVGGKTFRFHDLRHTHATQLLEHRIPLKVVSERLGHSTPAITMEIYAHVSRGMQEEAAEEFARWLHGATEADGPTPPAVD